MFDRDSSVCTSVAACSEVTEGTAEVDSTGGSMAGSITVVA